MDQYGIAFSPCKAAVRILVEGQVAFTRHALEELKKDGLTTDDAARALRAGSWKEAEWENGAWRHQVHAADYVVVAEFVEELKLLVITAWRKKR